MKITVLKSTVEAALAPILKMVSNAKLPADFHPTLTIQSDKQRITIGCPLPEQQLSVVLPGAVFDEKNTSFDVNLEMFRRMIAAATGTRLSIEQDAAHVVLNCDERFIGQLVPMTSKSDAKFQIPKDADTTVLPTNFANFLLQAFSCAGDEKDRLALSGVNVSPRGIAGTDGKQLFHLPLPLQLKNAVTIPNSKVYASLKNLRWTSLAHWRTASGEWMFSMAGDEFRHTAKALEALYPEYWRIIPKEGSGDVKFTLTKESAQELQRFMNENTSEATATLTVHPDQIVLLETSDKDMTQRKGVFASSSQSGNLPCSVRFPSGNLRQFLKMGFLTLSFSSKSPSPLVSSAGTGKYLFMPCGSPTRSATTAPASAAASTPPTAQQSKPEIKPAVISKNPTNNPTNNQTKEKKTMSQTITTTSGNPAVANPAAAFARVQPAVQTNPLDETLASLASMREQLSNLEARLMEAGRKIKAALVEQRLKERQYADANRKLERIRLAV
ncbi:MAG: hypothetical protein IJJ33_19070 [Victivallales bacterium]|nr:hypothetical protein [Victivallales bacterium]